MLITDLNKIYTLSCRSWVEIGFYFDWDDGSINEVIITQVFI